MRVCFVDCALDLATLRSTLRPDSSRARLAPEQDSAKALRSIPMGRSPTVFAELDADTVVVGFYDYANLEVWNLATGQRVRRFEGKGHGCGAMLQLSGGRIAVGWCKRSPDQWVVAVYDATLGKQVQELPGLLRWDCLAFVQDHLIAIDHSTTISVWVQDSAGMVCRQRLQS